MSASLPHLTYPITRSNTTMSKPQQPTDDDASNPKFNVSCFEFLLIELVPLAYRITAELTARDNALLASASQAYPFSKSLPDRTSFRSDVDEGTGSEKANGAMSTNGTLAGTGAGTIAGAEEATDDEETRESVFYRLDSLGYRVGQGLVER